MPGTDILHHQYNQITVSIDFYLFIDKYSIRAPELSNCSIHNYTFFHLFQ